MVLRETLEGRTARSHPDIKKNDDRQKISVSKGGLTEDVSLELGKVGATS